MCHKSQPQQVPKNGIFRNSCINCCFKILKMYKMYLFLVLGTFISIVSSATIGNHLLERFDKSECSKSVPEVIRGRGYPCEIHHVTTDDGYILTLHRIPHGRTNIDNNSGYWNHRSRPYPVLMQHGLLSSAASWTLDLPYQPPALIFADQGYDVWLGNIRGNEYSTNHTHLSLKSKEFWQFSYDEMGKYDIPAFIDYILKTTRKHQLHYIGHSMGTTMFFSGMSLRPEYNKYIKSMYALGPVGTVGHIETCIKYLAAFNGIIEFTWEEFGYYHFLPNDGIVSRLTDFICTKFHIEEAICTRILFFITGSDSHEFDYKLLPLVTDQLLSGTSIYTVLHYAQEYRSGKFQAFNYGYYENMRRYGQATPPLYDISKVTAPVNLIWGKNDLLADPEDVKYLIHNLPNVLMKHPVKDPLFNHLDFLYAKDLHELVYKEILTRMELP